MAKLDYKPGLAYTWQFPIEPYRGSDAAKKHFKNTADGDSGFYPVGLNRTWHGGVHLWRKPKQDPQVQCCADGMLVAARVTDQDAGGWSRSFALVKHTISHAKTEHTVWSLYYHLAAEPLDGTSKVPWLAFLSRAGEETSAHPYYRVDWTGEGRGKRRGFQFYRGKRNKGKPKHLRKRGSIFRKETEKDEHPLVKLVKGRTDTGRIIVHGQRVTELKQEPAECKRVLDLLKAGKVAVFKKPIPLRRGERLGEMGSSSDQDVLQFEVFTAKPLPESLVGSDLQTITDPNDDPLADAGKSFAKLQGKVKELFDASQEVDEAEIKSIAQEPELRKLVVCHMSEWAATEWKRLRERPFNMDDEEYKETLAEIQAHQFWKDLGTAAPTPKGRLVDYHPIEFVSRIDASTPEQSFVVPYPELKLPQGNLNQVAFYIPRNYRAETFEIDLFVFVHGWASPKTIGEELSGNPFHEYFERGGKNAIFVAPHNAYASNSGNGKGIVGNLQSEEGFKHWLTFVLSTLMQRGPHAKQPVIIKSMVFAGHSAGGRGSLRILDPAGQIKKAADKPLPPNLKQAWFLDSTYSDWRNQSWLKRRTVTSRYAAGTGTPWKNFKTIKADAQKNDWKHAFFEPRWPLTYNRHYETAYQNLTKLLSELSWDDRPLDHEPLPRFPTKPDKP